METFQEAYKAICHQWQENQKAAPLALQAFKEKILGRPFVLFGATWIGDFVHQRMQENGIAVTCFCDNFVQGATPAQNGPILTAPALWQQYPDAIVLVTNDKAGPVIYQQLRELGFAENQLMLLKETNLQMLDLQQYTLQQLEPHIPGYERMYHFFTDNVSRQLILDRVRFYLFGTPIPMSPHPQYFEPDLVHLSRREVVVDAGFYTGDTAQEFIRQTGGRFAHYYGFEPDDISRAKGQALQEQWPNVEIWPFGLYEKTARLAFVSTQGAQSSGGMLVESPPPGAPVQWVDVIALDAFFADKPQLPTFIKMDIEGAEKSALLGAEHIIRTAKPKLAICAYHKPEDLYELTELIAGCNPDYDFYLRHYANYFWETVLYALPKA